MFEQIAAPGPKLRIVPSKTRAEIDLPIQCGKADARHCLIHRHGYLHLW